jgi:hypothetical protein
VDDARQKQDCLEWTLKLNPDHDKAKIELQSLAMPEAKEPAQPVKPVAQDQPQRIDHEVLQESIESGPIIQNPPIVNKPAAPIVTKSTVPDPVKPRKKLKNAGDSTYALAEKRRWKGLMIGLGIIAFVIFFTYIISPLSVIKVGGALTIIFFFIIIFSRQILDIFLNPIEKRMKQARRGARAEVKIGEILARLGDDYLVIHDVTADYGNIDHVVIGKDGNVFMIETKSHGGKVTIKDGHVLVNGHPPEKDFIKQSLRNSYWLRDKIETVTGVKPFVVPILVFTNAMVGYYPPCRGVHLTYGKNLLKTIERQGKNQKVGTFIWDKRDRIVELIQ